MISRHITKILDQAAFDSLSEQDKKAVSTHIADCADCRRSFEAARLSGILLKTTSVFESLTPSPFFQAKVMNAWRERQHQELRPIEAFRRWWQASAAPIFLMLVTTVILISLTFLAPQSSAADDSSVEVSSFNPYSTDAVILNQNQPRDLTNEQVFQLIYDAKTVNGSDSQK